jgi:hypothetical protein
LTQIWFFRGNQINTGPVTFNGRVVHLVKNGKPLVAGDIYPGQTYEVDLDTGDISSKKDQNK